MQSEETVAARQRCPHGFPRTAGAAPTVTPPVVDRALGGAAEWTGDPRPGRADLRGLPHPARRGHRPAAASTPGRGGAGLLAAGDRRLPLARPAAASATAADRDTLRRRPAPV